MKFIVALSFLTISLAQAAPHSGVLSVSSGATHACALMADHRASCWGLGDPTPLSSPSVGDLSALATGNSFTCGLRRNDGTVWCWGTNHAGQLGDGTGTDSAKPVQVRKQLTIRTVPLTNITAISAGNAHACALSGNTMWCWGQNADGEVGNYRATSPSLFAAEVIVNDGSDTPLNVEAMATGGAHSCGALGDGSGTAACWGYNKLEQLGHAAAGDRTNSPVPVIAPDGSDLVLDASGAMTAGNLHTCALLTEAQPQNNSIACWGDNESGELGNPYQFMSWTATPAPVVFPDGRKLTNLAAISGGNSFTCAMLASDGSVACWGADNYGQLGNHEEITGLSINPLPVQLNMNTLTGFTSLSAGGQHACAVQSDPTDPAPQPGVKCWGENNDGQLGLGTVDLLRHDGPLPAVGDWPLFTSGFDD